MNREAGGYAPIRDYAAIGDGRTVALVALDGSIDWLPLPDLDSPSVFASILDAGRGGRFALEPDVPFTVARRYLPDTNLLETTFTTDDGEVRVTDGLLFHGSGLAPLRELVRRVEGVAGTVPMRWVVEPRFGYGSASDRDRRRTAASPSRRRGADAIALRSFDAGEPAIEGSTVIGRFDISAGSTSMLVLSVARGEPLVFPGRVETLTRLQETDAGWRNWVGALTYEGPFRDAVLRSGLALKLLVFAPSAAIAGAATTSLPEEIGGVRNWDYRYSWIRDAAFTIGAFLALGYPIEAKAYFWWLMNASQLTHPRLQRPLSARRRRHALESASSRSTATAVRDPSVRATAPSARLQLDIYGALLAVRMALRERRAPARSRRGQAARGDRRSRLRDLDDPRLRHLGGAERATPFHRVEDDVLGRARPRDPARRLVTHPRRSRAGWRSRAERDPGLRGGAVLVGAAPELRPLGRLGGARCERPPGVPLRIRGARRCAHRGDARRDRPRASRWPFVRRYSGEDGVQGAEGAFLACSFWFADALARAGRVDEAVDADGASSSGWRTTWVSTRRRSIPSDGSFLGNFPQALPHLALIGAAPPSPRRSGGPREPRGSPRGRLDRHVRAHDRAPRRRASSGSLASTSPSSWVRPSRRIDPEPKRSGTSRISGSERSSLLATT